MPKMYVSATLYSTIEDKLVKTFPLYNKDEITKLVDTTNNLLFFIYNKHSLFLNYNKDNSGITEHCYVDIPRQDIKHFVVEVKGERIYYTTFIKILISLNLLKVDDTFCYRSDSSFFNINEFTKAFPKSYLPIYINIVPNKNDKNFSFMHIETEIFLGKKDKKSKTDHKKEHKSSPELLYIIDQTYNNKIDINKMHHDIPTKIGKKLKDEYNWKKDEDGVWCKVLVDKILDYDYANKLVIEAVKLNNKEFHFKQADTGRCYYSLSKMNKNLLPYLVYDNSDDLYEVDLANAQPMIYNLYYKNDLYYEKTSTGNFYSSLVDINDEKINTIEKVKALVMNIFFDFKKINPYTRKVLDSKYEGLADSLDSTRIKRIRLNNSKYNQDLPTSKSNKKYNIIPNPEFRKDENWFKLQSPEAKIFIKDGINVLKHKGINAFPRHDSYICHGKNVDEIKLMLEYLFKQETGMDALFRTKKIE